VRSEHAILEHLTQNHRTSQRRIAAGTGLSVGMVNLLLRRMVRKGLVKLERVNGRTLRYIVTPKGMTEKTILACQYLRHSYQQILKISRALEVVVAAETARNGRTPRVVFLGPADEILEILKIAAGQLGLHYRVAAAPADLDELLIAENLLVVTWAAGEPAERPERPAPPGVPIVNILETV